MEEAGAEVQTESLPSYDNSNTSRTKRSIIDNDNSDNDEEFESSGFYVREKTDKSDSKGSDESSNDSKTDAKLQRKSDCGENGISKDATDDENTIEPVESEHTDDDKKSEGDNSEDGSEKNMCDSKSSNTDLKNQAGIDKVAEEKLEKNTLEAEDQSEDQKNNDNLNESNKDVVEETEEKKSEQNGDKTEEEACKKKEIDDITEDNGNKSTDPDNVQCDSILKDHLTKNDEPKPGNSRESNQDAEEMEVEDDFDPSLLCPDISMDVDEAPVVPTDNGSCDGSTSPLLVARSTRDVDEITGVEVAFNLTAEEMDLRSRMYGSDNPVQQSKIHCTACNVHLGSALDGQANRFVHPLLKVLICKNCYHFYTSGEFEKDEDGSELYCRWCGQGGEVLCCSSCEFVFCKRCIRNNFGMKKFKEIRNSDDWNCFRCNMSQLQALRATCAEFWDYYRTQLAKASTMAPKDPTFMTTDHTKCCNQEQKNKDQARSAAAARKRKRKDSEDPDFVPGMDEPKKKMVPPPNAVPTSTPGILVIRPAITSASIPPRPSLTSTALGSGQVFRVGNTTFRPRTPTTGLGYTVTRPKVSTSSAGPGYIKILPQRMNQPRPQASYTVLSGNTKPTFTTIRPTASLQQRFTPVPRHAITTQNSVPPMKHEWFEKTVRAAARVNSNLSYTLTQLNRQQSQANSVESLAVVHNKLQEVLSTSINSLIQIRKNLRTEFIAGIKNIKFPPKPALSNPPPMVPLSVRSHQDDDDVIIVSPTVSPTGGSQSSSAASSITLGHGISLTTVKKNATVPPKTPVSAIKPISSITPSGNKTGGYLKVKSFSALQSVPSECITIPDDPPMVLDEKTGLVADPLEFCQVDMNDDGSSNRSQRSSKGVGNKKPAKSFSKIAKQTKVGEEKAEVDRAKVGDKIKTEDEKIDETRDEKVDEEHKSNEEKRAEKSDEKAKEEGDEKTENKIEEVANKNTEEKEDELTERKKDDSDEDTEEKEGKTFDNKDGGASNKNQDEITEDNEDEDVSDEKQDEIIEDHKDEDVSDKKQDEIIEGSKDEDVYDTKQDKIIENNRDEDVSDKKLDEITENETEEVTAGDIELNNDEEQDIQMNDINSTSGNSENGVASDEESDSLANFTYNTNEEPTEEVKKWLGAKVWIKKSRVVDEIVRAKSRVLNGDSENGS